jgi:hypothetical protein
VCNSFIICGILRKCIEPGCATDKGFSVCSNCFHRNLNADGVSEDIKMLCRPHQNHRFVSVAFPGDDIIAQALRSSLDKNEMSKILKDSDLLLNYLAAPYNISNFANALVDNVIQEGLSPSIEKIWGNFEDATNDVEPEGRGRLERGEIVKFFSGGEALYCRICDDPLVSYKYTASVKKEGLVIDSCDICSTCYHMFSEPKLLYMLKISAFVGINQLSMRSVEWDFESLTKSASHEDLPRRGFPQIEVSDGSKDAVYDREMVNYDKYNESKCKICGNDTLYLPVFAPISPFATVFDIRIPNREGLTCDIESTASLTLHLQYIQKNYSPVRCRWQPRDGGLLATCDNSSICIWAKDFKSIIATANIDNRLNNGGYDIDQIFTCLEWDPSGRLIATGTSNSSVIIWQLTLSEKLGCSLSKLTTLYASQNAYNHRLDDWRSEAGFSAPASKSRDSASRTLDDHESDDNPVIFVAWYVHESLLSIYSGFQDCVVAWFADILSTDAAAELHESSLVNTQTAIPNALFSQTHSPFIPKETTTGSHLGLGTTAVKKFDISSLGDFTESSVIHIEGYEDGQLIKAFAFAPNLSSRGVSNAVGISNNRATLIRFIGFTEEAVKMELVQDLGDASSIAYSHDGLFLAIGFDNIIRLMLIDEQQKSFRLGASSTEHSATVTDLAWLPSRYNGNSHILASTAQDKFCIIWQVYDTHSTDLECLRKNTAFNNAGNLVCIHRIPFLGGCSSISWVLNYDGSDTSFKLVVGHNEERNIYEDLQSRNDDYDESSNEEDDAESDESVICSNCFNDPSVSTVTLLHAHNTFEKLNKPTAFFKICGPKLSPTSLRQLIINRTPEIMRFHGISSDKALNSQIGISFLEEDTRGMTHLIQQVPTRSLVKPAISSSRHKVYQMLRPNFLQMSPHLAMGPMQLWDVAEELDFDPHLKMVCLQIVEPARFGILPSCRWWYPRACLQNVYISDEGSDFSPPGSLAKGLCVSIEVDKKRVFGTVLNDYVDDSKRDPCKLLLEGKKVRDIYWDFPSGIKKTGSNYKDAKKQAPGKNDDNKKCWCIKAEKSNERPSRTSGQDVVIDACLKVEKAHKGFRCSGQKCKGKRQDDVLGKLYTCSQCPDFYFCDDCFKGKERHLNGHKFVVKESPNDVSLTELQRPFRNHERRVPLESLEWARQISLPDTSPSAVKDAIRLAGFKLGPRNIHAVIILRSVDIDASSSFKLKLEVLGHALQDEVLEKVSVSGDDDVHRNVYLLREEFCGKNIQMIMFDNADKEPSIMQSMRYVVSVVDASGNSSDAFKQLKAVANGTRVVLYDFSFEDSGSFDGENSHEVDADTRIDVIMRSKDTGDETHDTLRNASLRPDVAFLSSMRCKPNPVWIVGVFDIKYKKFVDQMSSRSFVSRSRSLQFKYLLEGSFFTHTELKSLKHASKPKDFKKLLEDLCEQDSVKMSDDTLKDLRNMSYSDEVTDISELAASMFPPVLKVLTKLCGQSDIHTWKSLHQPLLQLLSYISVYSASTASRYTYDTRKLLKSFSCMFPDSLSIHNSRETTSSEVILDFLRHVFKTPSAETIQPTCRIMLSLQRAMLLASVQEQSLQYSYGKAVQSFILQRSYFETFSFSQTMNALSQNKRGIFSCPVIFGHILIMSGTQLYSHKDLISRLSIGSDVTNRDYAPMNDAFRFMCRAASLVLGCGPELALIVDGKKCVVTCTVAPVSLNDRFQHQSDMSAPAVASLQLTITFPGGSEFRAAKVEIVLFTDDIVKIVFLQNGENKVGTMLSLKTERHTLNQLLWICRCVEVEILPIDAKVKLTVDDLVCSPGVLGSTSPNILDQIKAWTQLDVFSLVFFKQPVKVCDKDSKEVAIENTAQIMGWSLVLDELQFIAMFLHVFSPHESAGAKKTMARIVFNRCRRWVFANFSPSELFVTNCEKGSTSVQVKVVHHELGSNGAFIPPTPKLHISHDGGTTWKIIEKMRLKRRLNDAPSSLAAVEILISNDQNRTNTISLSDKTKLCIQELLFYNFDYSTAAEFSDVACNFHCVFTQTSIKDEDVLRFAFHLWNCCCYCGIAWESADDQNFVFDKRILPSRSNYGDIFFQAELLRLSSLDERNGAGVELVRWFSDSTHRTEICKLFDKAKSDRTLAAQLSSLSDQVAQAIEKQDMTLYQQAMMSYLSQLKSDIFKAELLRWSDLDQTNDSAVAFLDRFSDKTLTIKVGRLFDRAKSDEILAAQLSSLSDQVAQALEKRDVTLYQQAMMSYISQLNSARVILRVLEPIPFNDSNTVLHEIEMMAYLSQMKSDIFNADLFRLTDLDEKNQRSKIGHIFDKAKSDKPLAAQLSSLSDQVAQAIEKQDMTLYQQAMMIYLSQLKSDVFKAEFLQLSDLDERNGVGVAFSDRLPENTQETKVIQLFHKAKSDRTLAAQLSSLSDQVAQAIEKQDMTLYQQAMMSYLSQLKSDIFKAELLRWSDLDQTNDSAVAFLDRFSDKTLTIKVGRLFDRAKSDEILAAQLSSLSDQVAQALEKQDVTLYQQAMMSYISQLKSDVFNAELLRLLNAKRNYAASEGFPDSTLPIKVVQLFDKAKSDKHLAAQLSSLSDQVAQAIEKKDMTLYQQAMMSYLSQLQSEGLEPATAILTVLEPVLFKDVNAFKSKMADIDRRILDLRSQNYPNSADLAFSRNWPIFFMDKRIVDHVHVLFTAALQATVEPVKADLTTLEFQIRVKKWQRDIDQPIWQESQSSVQKFWSRSIDRSFEVFFQSIFKDMSAGPIFNSRFLYSSKIRSDSHDIGQWNPSTCSFFVVDTKIDDTTESRLRLAIKAGVMPMKHYNVVHITLSSDASFYLQNPAKKVRPLVVEVEKKKGKGTKKYYMFPSPGHEACIQKLQRLWRLTADNKYSHETLSTATMMKNALATIPRLYRSDPTKFGEVMCLFQSLSHEDATVGLHLVTEIFCQYEHPSLRNPNCSPLLLAKQFTGLRSLRLCLRNFSDQKETLCCVLLLLLKLLLWKKTSTEKLAVDETGSSTQVYVIIIYSEHW